MCIRDSYKASELGSSFAFWAGELNQDQRGRVFIALEGQARGLPIPDWAKIADSCPNVAGIDNRILQFVCNNQTVSQPCEGGNAIMDSTPNFGRRGPRGVC